MNASRVLPGAIILGLLSGAWTVGRTAVPAFTPEAPCGTRAIWFSSFPMIPMPPDGRKGYRPPQDVFASFVVTPLGLVDTASVEFYPALPASSRDAATGAMRGWMGTRRSTTGANPAVCTILRFADTTADRFVELPQDGERASWRVQGDGFVAHWRQPSSFGPVPGKPAWELLNQRGQFELYSPRDLLNWLDRIDRYRDSARSVSPESIPEDTRGSRYAEAPLGSTAWSTSIGNGEGELLTAGMVRRRDSRTGRFLDPPLLALETGTCGARSTFFERPDRPIDSLLVAARAAAREALAFNNSPRIDTLALYSPLQVGCPATRSDTTLRALRVDDSIQAALQLPRDAVVNFIVDREGSIERSSIGIFGKWSTADRERISASVTPLRYRPATLAGFRVRQFTHQIIKAGAPTTAPVLDKTALACRVQGSVAVTVRPLAPTTEQSRALLERIGDAVLQKVAPLVRPGMTDGRFRFVLVPGGAVTFLTWLDPASDTMGVRRALWDPKSIGFVYAASDSLGPNRESRKIWPLDAQLRFPVGESAVGYEVLMRQSCQ